MQQFEINGIEDLLSNPSFKRWVLSDNEEDGTYWSQWISHHPDKLEWLAAAKEIIQILEGEQNELPQERINAATLRILDKIHQLPLSNESETEDSIASSEQANTEAVISPLRAKKWIGWVVAASIISAIAVTVSMLNNGLKQTSMDVETAMFTTNPGDIVYENTTDSAKQIALPDGSQVSLYKGGKLKFVAGEKASPREAFLSGSAFFSVMHNPSKPFVVYTKSIVTKVLGTSFYIKAMPGETTSLVAVTTGKVSVFKKEKFTQQDARPGTLEGLVITPNQQVKYEEQSGTISKDLVAAPSTVENKQSDNIFDATPAITVFKKLQEAYGIPIIIDESALASCSITASFKRNESFYEKIAIICQTINASYEVVDASIVITSKGCK